jgi:FAD/FMN-containing dehydrogenase
VSDQYAGFLMLPQGFVDAVCAEFGSDFLKCSPDLLADYGQDWTRIYTPDASAVVFPRSTQEVSSLLKLCLQYEVPVVPSGGRTGLSGGAVAAHGELVLSLDKMAHMDPVCQVSRTIRVQAGAVTKAVHDHCREEGLMWPVDFASAGSSQIGGNIATNAGGIRVVRYGLTRQWVLGLQVVLMGGEVLELNGDLEKNNTGYDLRQLFIGSEGTLGVVTEAVLRLAPLPRATALAFVAAKDLSQLLTLFKWARREAKLTIQAFEYVDRSCLEMVLKHRRQSDPFAEAYPAYGVVEVEGHDAHELREALGDWLAQGLEHNIICDGVLAQNSDEAARLWILREGVSESLTREAFLYKFDIAVSVARLVDFSRAVSAMVTERIPKLQPYLFGHVGDGNLHLNLLMPSQMERSQFITICREFEKPLFEMLQAFGGSVSAEHGIGLLKKTALPYSRSAREIDIFAGIKRLLDLNNLMNPGKVITTKGP